VPTADPDNTVVLVLTEVLSRASARNPAVVTVAKEKLAIAADKHLATYGYRGIGAAWTTEPPDDATGNVVLRLEVEMVERDDGEWPALHQAMREDEDDRRAASEGLATVNDRLDALKAAAALWRSPGLTEACQGAGAAMSGLSGALQEVGRAVSTRSRLRTVKPPLDR